MVGLPEQAEMARRLIELRHHRSDELPGEMFDESAWEILLALFVARVENRSASTAELFAALHVEHPTGIRWVRFLIAERYVDGDENGLIALTDHGFAALSRYLDRSVATCATV